MFRGCFGKCLRTLSSEAIAVSNGYTPWEQSSLRRETMIPFRAARRGEAMALISECGHLRISG
jgi:hypothetical protein